MPQILDGDVQTMIAETVKAHPVALFMKGSPTRPQCSFSAAVVDALRQHHVPFHSVDVLPDPALRRGIKTFSNWPTIPQLYVGGGFVGGCGIVRERRENAEPAELLASALGTAP